MRCLALFSLVPSSCSLPQSALHVELAQLTPLLLLSFPPPPSRPPAVNTLRASRALSQLDIFTISLVGGEDAHRHGAEVEVEVATKMGSTGIREWLDRRERERAQREGEGERGAGADAAA